MSTGISCHGGDAIPRLGKVALDVLTCPTSESSVERLFSILAFVLSKNRTTLAPEIVNAIIFLRANGIVNRIDFINEDYFEAVEQEQE